MTDHSAPDSPPPRTTGGNWNWTPPSAAELEAILPGYTVEKLIGRGGMGAVYKGVQSSLDRPVAIKILPDGIGKEDLNFAERFRNEAKVMALLLHPAIVTVFDFGQAEGGQLYFVMEYVDGTDVHQMILAQGKLSADYALAITAHICDALGAAHALGIVHRDIKPANVLINQQGQVKVADFGLAKIEGAGDRGLTKTGFSMGTPDFLAPESMTLGMQVDGRADIYAAGVMLYRMLTGEVPRGAFKSPSEKVPGLDPRFDPIVDKAMQSEQGDRYQSSGELRRDLDVILTVPLPQTGGGPETSSLPWKAVADVPGQRSAAPQMVVRGKRKTEAREMVVRGKRKTEAREMVVRGKHKTEAREVAEEAMSKIEDGSPKKESSKKRLYIGVAALSILVIGGLVAFLMQSGDEQDTGNALLVEVKTPNRKPADNTAASTSQAGKEPTEVKANPEKKPATTLAKSNAPPATEKPNVTAPKKPAEPAPEKAEPKATETKPTVSVSVPPAIKLVKTGPTPAELEKQRQSELLAIPGLKTRLDGYINAQRTQVSELASKYLKGLDTKLNQAADAGDTQLVKTLREEKARVADLQKSLDTAPANSVVGVEQRATLPDLAENTPDGLTDLRKIWTTERQKIRSTLDIALQQSLTSIETNLTKSRDSKNAEKVLAYRGTLTNAKPVSVATVGTPLEPKETSKLSSGNLSTGIKAATKDKPFENTLGMRFVPVPITGGPSDGKHILFSIWETRVEDYAAFIKNDSNRKWSNPDFEMKDGHPALSLNWEDAQAFCAWLTKEDQRKGKLGKDEHYRLPTDHEWSCAVGIGKEEEPHTHPSIKSAEIANIYPWGKQFPPPKGAGNYYGEETQKNPFRDKSTYPPIVGYDDGFDLTAPVGSFEVNEYGLYDMGGNAQEWCDDWLNPVTKENRVQRGSSWASFSPANMLSSFRSGAKPLTSYKTDGFRCVIATNYPATKPAPEKPVLLGF